MGAYPTLRLSQFLWADRSEHADSWGDVDPFRSPEVLTEAQLIDVRLDAVAGSLGVIVEMRTAIEDLESDTGVLVCSGVRRTSWSAPSRSTALTAWTIASLAVAPMSDGLALSLACWPSPGAHLEVLADRATFLAGNVLNLGPIPPDYSESAREGVEGRIADWSSELLLKSVAHY